MFNARKRKRKSNQLLKKVLIKMANIVTMEQELNELRLENSEMAQESAQTNATLSAIMERLSQLENGMNSRLDAMESRISSGVQMLGTRPGTPSGYDSDASVASHLSNISEGGSLPRGYSYSGFKTRVNGKFYPIVIGPNGGKRTLRETGRLVELSARQDSIKVPVE